MSPERSYRPSPAEQFGFSEKERLYDRVSDRRFRDILANEQTTVHSVNVDRNTYGDFLFVSVSRPVGEKRIGVTFWGAGYHEYRERWLTNEWRWYVQNSVPPEELPKPDAEALIEKRRSQIAPYATDGERSSRAKLFELIADLTDEDGAYSELGDLEDMFGDLPDLPDDF